MRIYNSKIKRVQWHTSVKVLENVPGGKLLQNLESTLMNKLLSYDDGDNEMIDRGDQDPEPKFNRSISSDGATQVERDIDQNQPGPGDIANHRDDASSSDVNQSVGVTVQPGCRIDYLLGSYALENIKDAERKQAKGALSRSLYR